MRTFAPPIVGFLIIAGLSAALLNYGRSREPIHFSNVKEALDFFTSQGLHCHSGDSTGAILQNGFASDRPITFEDVAPIGSRLNCGMTPEWKGLVWFAEMRDVTSVALLEGSVGGHYRVWGNIIVAGDKDLIDRIEQLYWH